MEYACFDHCDFLQEVYPKQFPDLVLTHIVIMCGKVSLSLSLVNVTVAERDSESHRTVGGITPHNLALCLNTRWAHT